MVASVRSVAANTLVGQAELVARGDAQAGDLLLGFHSADGVGGLGPMTLAGFAGIDQLAGVGWSGTVISQRIATASEAAQYNATQGGTDTYGVLFVLAVRGADPSGIVITRAAGPTAPAATPGSASGLEIRYGAGRSVLSTSWAQIPGYDGTDEQSGVFVSGSIAVRPYLSSAPVAAVSMGPSATVLAPHAWTILVASSDGSGSGPPPTPPTFPASTPAKGVSWMRYTVHDLLTGAYHGDFYPSGVVLDRRIGEPGTWKGRLSLANTAEANKINEILPRDPNDLLSGPGRLVIHSWRGGVLWGLHWLHTTVTTKDERGAVYMDLQASTLDGYMLHVALEEDLLFGDDQITNARALIQHMQATPASNAGLGMQDGTSGSSRPLTAVPGVNVTFGQILQNYARQAGGFEYVINPRVVDGSIIRSWEWGAPIISRPDTEHAFTEGVEGGDITTWREERSALRGGTRWGAYGGTPRQEDATMGSTPVRSALVLAPHVAAGHPIVDRRVQHPTDSTDQTTIDDYAAYWAARAPGAPPVFSADVVIGKNSTLDPNGLGDYIKYKLNNPRYPIIGGGSSFNLRQRLLGWSLTPAERGRGKDRVQLITEQASEEP